MYSVYCISHIAWGPPLHYCTYKHTSCMMAYPAIPTDLREVHPRREAGTALSFGLESTRKLSRYWRWPKPGVYRAEEVVTVGQVGDCHGNHVMTPCDVVWHYVMSCDPFGVDMATMWCHVMTLWCHVMTVWWPCDDHMWLPSNPLWLDIQFLDAVRDYRPPFQWVWFTRLLGKTGN